MGIKHFFTWFKTNFSDQIEKLPKDINVQDLDVVIDNLMIDMNGIIHNSAQKIYEYGSFKRNNRLLGKNKTYVNFKQKNIKLYEDVCNSVDIILNVVKPTKRLVICIDGPAPISKQNQQRQRRYRSAMESLNSSCPFDSNSITPGTQFMDNLSKYMDFYIKKKINEDSYWKNIEVIFSNEKAPGEGEHKIVNYMRYYGNENETYCINGLDADLIMLALGTHLPKFYILREDMYDPTNEYFLINIGEVHHHLSELIRWQSEKFTFDKVSAINDFIFLCFMVGNDFLPHIPSIEIIENGLELILNVYKEVGTGYGHITENKNNKLYFIKNTLKIFLETIGNYEQENFENKLNSKRSFFKDELLSNCSTQNPEGKWEVNINKYRKDYLINFTQDYPEENIVHEYLEGMQWVLSYYTRGVPNWTWNYKHHYAPPASILAKYMDCFEFVEYGKTIPSTPFQQLLCVLPPKSSNLIPYPLNTLLTNEDSPLKEYCPESLTIDYSGKTKEWEGIVLLPMVDIDLVKKVYLSHLNSLKPQDSRRNIMGRSFIYQYNPKICYEFTSYYGKISNCNVKYNIIDL
jgi:5'-3' exonuclease